MRKLTLEECMERPITDLFLAVIVTNLSEEEGRKIISELPEESEVAKQINEFNELVDETADKFVKEGKLSKDSKDNFSILCKEMTASILERVFVVPLLKIENDQYQNLSADDIDFSQCTIKHLEPFGDYYCEHEYRYVIYEGKVVVDVDSLEPFERFEAKNIK